MTPDPRTDPTIAALSADRRAVLAGLWQERACSESSVGTVFEQLRHELIASAAPAEVIALATRAAADEVRHAAVCTALASAYLGAPLDAPVVTPVRLPDYGESSPRRRAALHAINLCCIGETIATAFVEACLADCAGPVLRDLHGKHLSDEVRHARVGWAFMATLSRAERDSLASAVPQLLDAQLTVWTTRIGELPEAGVPGHGYPPRAVLLAAVHDAISALVLSGFDHVGIDTAAARSWYATREHQRQRGG
jgi:hypothetical protein